MILMYHKVAPVALTQWWVDADNFYRQMHELRQYNPVFLDEYDPSDPKQVVITFDGVYRNVRLFAAPLLQKYGYPFELFISGDHVGQGNDFDTGEPDAPFASVEELSEMVSMGGRLQWHSKSHADLRRITDQGQLEIELHVPQELRVLDPAGFGWFAYPYGEFDERSLDAVRSRFKGAVSCVQGGGVDRHKLNRMTVVNETKFSRRKVSVIVASYNYGRFLPDAIESVLHQTVLPDEILISDDCSTDNTWEIAEEYQRQYPDLIRVNRNESNLGVVGHFNKAVRLTYGDYFCILGADNRLCSNYLESTSCALDQNAQVAVAYTDFVIFGPRAAVLADEFKERWLVEHISDDFFRVRFPDYNENSVGLLKQNINFMHGSSLIRRGAFEAVGGYVEERGNPEDFDLFVRMVSEGWQAAHSNNTLLEYRQHSRQQANIQVGSEATLRFYQKGYQRLEMRIAELEGEINRISTSRSWRMTMPFRVIARLLRGECREVFKQIRERFGQ